jgi:positive regulator of sigma E activity
MVDLQVLTKSFYSYLMVFIEMLIQLFLENTKAKLIFHREVLIEGMFFCLDAYFWFIPEYKYHSKKDWLLFFWVF